MIDVDPRTEYWNRLIITYITDTVTAPSNAKPMITCSILLNRCRPRARS
jgi:hypothetical protein